MHLHLLPQCASSLSMYSSLATLHVYFQGPCFIAVWSASSAFLLLHIISLIKSIHTPMNLILKLIMDPGLLRLLNSGKLLYLTVARPGVSFFCE